MEGYSEVPDAIFLKEPLNKIQNDLSSITCELDKTKTSVRKHGEVVACTIWMSDEGG